MGLIKSEYDLDTRDREVGHYRVYDIDLLKNDLTQQGFKIKDSGGVFFKCLSNSQIQEHLNEKQIQGFYLLGKQFPYHAAVIYVVATV